jgi:hypothetical protein
MRSKRINFPRYIVYHLRRKSAAGAKLGENNAIFALAFNYVRA